MGVTSAGRDHRCGRQLSAAPACSPPTAAAAGRRRHDRPPAIPTVTVTTLTAPPPPFRPRIKRVVQICWRRQALVARRLTTAKKHVRYPYGRTHSRHVPTVQRHSSGYHTYSPWMTGGYINQIHPSPTPPATHEPRPSARGRDEALALGAAPRLTLPGSWGGCHSSTAASRACTAAGTRVRAPPAPATTLAPGSTTTPAWLPCPYSPPPGCPPRTRLRQPLHVHGPHPCRHCHRGRLRFLHPCQLTSTPSPPLPPSTR